MRQNRKSPRPPQQPKAILDPIPFIVEEIRLGRTEAALAQIDANRADVDAHELASYLAGLLRATRGDLSAALDHFSQAVALNPANAQALNARAVIHQNLGQLDAAIADCKAALELQPFDAQAWTALGSSEFCAGRMDRALDAYASALAHDPGNPDARRGRALTLLALGRDRDALEDFDGLAAAGTATAADWRNRAVALTRLGETVAAAQAYLEALARDPGYLEAAEGAALALLALGRAEEAVSLAVAHMPPQGHAPLLFIVGNAHLTLGRGAEAAEAFAAAALLDPNDPKIFVNQAAALLRVGDFAAALASVEQALRLAPDLSAAWRSKGNAELKLCRFEAAIGSFERALVGGKDDADCHCGMGIALKELARFDEALAAFDRALAVDCGHAQSKCNKGGLLMLLGDFAGGLPLFEYRALHGETPVAERRYAWPRWAGEHLAGRRIVVLDEAGLGDAIQYARYLPMLAVEGAHVAFACRPALRALLATLGPDIACVDLANAGPRDYDFCAPLCSLPLHFRTRLATIPAPGPYLRAEAARVANWRALIGTEGFRVGLCWRGNAHPEADHARSAPLAALAPLAQIDGVRLISLQKGLGTEELDAAPAGMRIETLGPDFDAGPDAFLDTAAVMECLDLVVTIDTSIAHLAGALGRPAWIALKHVPEWRWLLARDDSPWHPGARLFRQIESGVWDDVFARMAATLRALPALPEALMLPGSVGELLDRISILEIKAERIADAEKRANVVCELDLLAAERRRLVDGPDLRTAEAALKQVNLALWEIEDAIRLCEKREDFGPEFIRLARSVYTENDRRAALKRDVNRLSGSRLVEEKSYA